MFYFLFFIGDLQNWVYILHFGSVWTAHVLNAAAA